MSAVAPSQRFTRSQPCPICGGGQDDPRGAGVRCRGFLMRGKQSAVCSRGEYAGSLPFVNNVDGYIHSLDRSCQCGANHGAPPVTRTDAPANRNGHSSPRSTTRYEIRDEHGAPVAVHVREDFVGAAGQPDKRLWWNQPNGERGLGGLRRDDVPLYGVHELAAVPADNPIIVTEGEKARDALAAHGVAAVGTVTGSSGTPAAAVLRPLMSRPVVLWPDADGQGRHHMERIAASLHRLGHHDVRILTWPEAPAKGDAHDFFALGGTVDGLRVLVSAAAATPSAEPTSPEPGMVRRLHFTALGDLLSEPTEVTSWLVENRLPTSGLSLLAGKPKAGKSTLARCLALCVARGIPWLDMATIPGDVLYLALEEKREEVRQHFAAMGGRADDRVHVHCAPSPEDGLEQLREAAARYQPVLIVIDPLFRFVRVPDGNDYATVTTALEPVLSLARDTKAHVLTVHHLGKGERSGGDAILGSTAIFAAVDTALFLRRAENYRTLSSQQRYGTDLDEITVALDPVTRMISAGPKREDADRVRAEAEIVDFLRTATQPQPAAAIEEAIECRHQTFLRALKALVPGRVTRTGRGGKGDPFLYSIAAEESDSGSPDISGNQGTTIAAPSLSADGTANSGADSSSRLCEKVIVVPSDPGNHKKRDIDNAVVAPADEGEV